MGSAMLSTRPLRPTTSVGRQGQLALQAVAAFLVGFVLIWVVLYAIFQRFPYVSTGSDIIYRTKVQQETYGTIFPADKHRSKILIAGNSQVLDGFIPALFDQLAAGDDHAIASFNSGYPQRIEFVTELRQIVRNPSNVPDVLLLTYPWDSKPNRFDPFRPISDEHAVIEHLFPFRYLPRDSVSYVLNARRHGGLLSEYRDAKLDSEKMLRDNGYYFIAEQSESPSNSLPENYHLSSDRPELPRYRTADIDSEELAQLNAILTEHRIKCYFVPYYLRISAAAPAPAYDEQFGELLEHSTTCRMIGPNYFSYPNRMFSDYMHLNPAGANVYTKDLYTLLKANGVFGH